MQRRGNCTRGRGVFPALRITGGQFPRRSCRTPSSWSVKLREARTRRNDLQYNPGFQARRVQGIEMFRTPKYLLVLLALAALTARPAYAQDKNKDPRVVLELEKSPPANDSNAKEPAGAHGATHLWPAEPFGKACSSFGAPKDGYRNFDRPYSVSELFGAPIAVIIIRRLGPFQEKPDRDEIRKHIVAVLNAQTTEVSRYVEWDESVPLGIVATVQFSDRTKGVLEESGGHVCFSDYAGTVWWLRIPIPAKPQP
jgi:hypothetical protein